MQSRRNYIPLFPHLYLDHTKGVEKCKDSLQQTWKVQDAICLGCKVFKKCIFFGLHSQGHSL